MNKSVDKNIRVPRVVSQCQIDKIDVNEFEDYHSFIY
jgi:hypothetical protein